MDIKKSEATQKELTKKDFVSDQDVRWGRSIYVNTEQREVSIRLQDMRPLTQWSSWPVQSEGPVSLMFVVDTLNTAPATSGVIWLDDIRLEEWN